MLSPHLSPKARFTHQAQHLPNTGPQRLRKFSHSTAGRPPRPVAPGLFTWGCEKLVALRCRGLASCLRQAQEVVLAYLIQKALPEGCPAWCAATPHTSLPSTFGTKEFVNISLVKLQVSLKLKNGSFNKSESIRAAFSHFNNPAQNSLKSSFKEC